VGGWLAVFLRRERFRHLSNGMVQPDLAKQWPALFRRKLAPSSPAKAALHGLHRSRSVDALKASEGKDKRAGGTVIVDTSAVDAAVSKQSSQFGPDHSRVGATAIDGVAVNDRRIVRTRTLMRNRADTFAGAGIVISTVKALVREGDNYGEVYAMTLETQPKADVRVNAPSKVPWPVYLCSVPSVVPRVVSRHLLCSVASHLTQPRMLQVTVRMVTSTMGDSLNIFPPSIVFTPKDWYD